MEEGERGMERIGRIGEEGERRMEHHKSR
jgi:hypothetical protein